MFQKLTLRQARVMMGLTQSQLAEKLCISEKTVSKHVDTNGAEDWHSR